MQFVPFPQEQARLPLLHRLWPPLLPLSHCHRLESKMQLVLVLENRSRLPSLHRLWPPFPLVSDFHVL